MAGRTPRHPESHCPGLQMIPIRLQLRKFPLTSWTMLAQRQRPHPKAVMVDSASLESHEKQTNFPASSLTTPTKPYWGNRREAQQRHSACTFLGKCINRDMDIAIMGRKRPIFKKKSDAVKCDKCEIKTMQKVDSE